MDSGSPANAPLTQSLGELLDWLERQAYAFHTVTPATHARVNARPGAQAARTIRDVFGWSRPFRSSLLPPAVLASLRAGGLVQADGDDLLRASVRVSSLGERLFAHSAYPTQASDAVFFGPDTYRFVQLIRAELARRSPPPNARLLDIGCGAGPGGIVAASECAGLAPQLLLSDINPIALAFARANAGHAGCKAEFCQSDLLRSVDGDFDLVIANPPYLNDATHRVYRHGGGEYGEGLSLRIVREVLPRLRPRGRLIVYTAAAIVEGVDPLLSQLRRELDARCVWRYWELDPDVFGEELDSPAYESVERIAAVALVVERPAHA